MRSRYDTTFVRTDIMKVLNGGESSILPVLAQHTAGNFHGQGLSVQLVEQDMNHRAPL